MTLIPARRVFPTCVILFCCLAGGCQKAGDKASDSSSKPAAESSSPEGEKKIAVLLVSHGSHSANWRKMVLEIEDAVRGDVLRDGNVAEIRSAFMEYTEPTIAARLKEFDEMGHSDIIVVPLLLTISGHSFDDIPVICGQKQDHKTSETLKLEGIEIYKPRARVHFAPLLDFPAVLGKNVARRVKQMSKNPKDEGVVLVAYGDEEYDAEWNKLIADVAAEVKRETGIDCCRHAWCGHIVRYKSEPTQKAVSDVLQQKRTALVVPLLVAVDENFQGKIIGGGVKSAGEAERIVYRHDAVLPDENINKWVIEISQKLAADIRNNATASTQ